MAPASGHPLVLRGLALRLPARAQGWTWQHRQSSSPRVQNLLRSAGASATSQRALVFELLESKLRPPQGRLDGVAHGPSTCWKARVRLRSFSWPPAPAGGRRHCSLNGQPPRTPIRNAGGRR